LIFAQRFYAGVRAVDDGKRNDCDRVIDQRGKRGVDVGVADVDAMVRRVEDAFGRTAAVDDDLDLRMLGLVIGRRLRDQRLKRGRAVDGNRRRCARARV
jgi:hypothetical protein